MRVLMGGSGSTGSSLLKNVMGRHSQIFVSTETNLFCKSELYTNWTANKNRILKRQIRGLRNHSWHIYNGVDIELDIFGINQSELLSMIAQHNSLQSFADQLYQGKQHQVWIDKTPANSCNFARFLSEIENAKVVHMRRNPLDTIASLWSRGYTLYYAAGIYFVNTTLALSNVDNNYCEVHYEALVEDPKSAVQGLCNFLNLSYENGMIEGKGEKISVTQLESWNYDETAAIGKKSVGRFTKLNDEKKDAIYAMINHLKSSNSNFFNLQLPDLRSLVELSYPDLDIPVSHYGLAERRKEMKTDRRNRLKRLYKTGFTYPLDLR